MPHVKNLNKQLFNINGENFSHYLKTYMIIDAAKIKKLTHEILFIDNHKWKNLFIGEDADNLENVAPYLVELNENDNFTTWIYKNVYGNNGGIFLHSEENIDVLAEHFRPYITTTIEVEHPIHKNEKMETKAYVRLYDPRVFLKFIKSLEVKDTFFSAFNTVYVESQSNSNNLYHITKNTSKEVSLLEEVR